MEHLRDDVGVPGAVGIGEPARSSPTSTGSKRPPGEHGAAQPSAALPRPSVRPLPVPLRRLPGSVRGCVGHRSAGKGRNSLSGRFQHPSKNHSAPARPHSWQAGNNAEPNGAYLLLRAGVSLKKPWSDRRIRRSARLDCHLHGYDTHQDFGGLSGPQPGDDTSGRDQDSLRPCRRPGGGHPDPA
jgi:hypothetical protein